MKKLSVRLNLQFSLLFIFHLLFVTIPEGITQEKSDYLINPTGDTIPVESIPILEINSRLENIAMELNKFPAIIKKTADINRLDSILSTARRRLEAEEAEIIKNKESLTIRQIDDLKKEWQGYEQTLIDWQDKVASRINTLEEKNFDTKRIISTWEKTLADARRENLPDASITRIEEVINGAKNIQTKIGTRQDSVIIIQNHITDFKIRVSQIMETLNETRIDLQSEYFVQDSPFLWKASDSTTKISSISKEIGELHRENLSQISRFFDSNRTNWIIHLVVFFLLLFLFYYLNRKYVSGSTDEELITDETRIIFRYFYASSFLLALLFSLVIYPGFPNAVRETFQLLMFVPAIVLLPRLIKRNQLILFYLIIAIILYNSLISFLHNNTIFLRLLVLIQSAFLIWIISMYTGKNNKIWSDEKPDIKNLVQNLKIIYLILLWITVITNILGFVNLTIVTLNAIVTSLLAAVLLILVVIISNSLFRVLFMTKLFRFFNTVKNKSKKLLHRLNRLFIYIALFIWLRAIIISIGLLDATKNMFISLFNYKWEIGNGEISIGGIIAFFLAIIITAVFTRFVKNTLEEEVFPRIKLARGVPGAISMLVRYTIVAFGIFIALTAAGLDLSKFGLIAGALGVGIGFGLQGIVYNFIAGLILAFERPIQKGDTIEVGNLLGDVTGIGVRSSTVRTYDGSEVIVPNGNLISNEVINWTLSDRKRRRVINVGVAYGSNPREVIDILYKVADEHPEVHEFPKPWPLFDGFGDSSLNFRILFWVDFDRGLTIQSEIAMKIYDALAEAGISIPFPQQDLHVKSFDPTIQKTIFPHDLIRKKKPGDESDGDE